VTPDAGSEFGHAYEQFIVGGNQPPFADAPYHSERIPLPGVPVGLVAGERVGYARASLGGFSLLEPSLTYVTAGEVRDSWKRVVALERTFDVPSLSFVRLPGVRIRGGVSYSLDKPYEKKAQGYLRVTYVP
jgi:hypothetical protein